MKLLKATRKFILPAAVWTENRYNSPRTLFPFIFLFLRYVEKGFFILAAKLRLDNDGIVNSETVKI